MINLEHLNDMQKKAVLAPDGPLLIIAGAGSGKTSVLTAKVAYLIEDKGVSPKNVLAITFTNKAAKEMKQRIIKLVGPKGYEIQISTFHSFGLRIIKENYDKLGYEKNFTIIDNDDSITLVKKIIKDMGLDVTRYNPRVIRNNISSAKNELVFEKEYALVGHDEIGKITSDVYTKYQDALRRNNSLDFDDLLVLPIKLFKAHHEILENYQELFKYIFIDEYQDTNMAQYTLAKMISKKYNNICVVGDDAQSIYSFRGANYKNILNFEKDYKNAKVILLEQNYRSTKNILKAANSLIKKNVQKKDKNLWTDNEEGQKIKYIRTNDEKDEARTVTEEIKRLQSEGVNLDDVAVLYRTNAQSRTIEEAFLSSNIPYRIVGTYGFYARKEIKDLLSYLHLIYNPKDDVSLLRVINYPKRGIGDKTIQNLSDEAASKNISIFEAITSGKEQAFKDLINSMIKKSESLTLTEIVDMILDLSGIKKDLTDEHSLEADIRLENLSEFKSITKTFEEESGLVSLDDFLSEIALVSDVNDQKNEDASKVTLMTIHAVKGLEFDYVFVIGLEEEIFPHINSIEEDGLEEERRLCYVAVTRAKKQLYLLNALRRTLFGRTSVNMPSRFILEMGSDCLEANEKKTIATKQIDKSLMFNEDNNLNVGDKVIHDTYGPGVVVMIDKTIATIAFKCGIKKLMKNHKSIKKV